MQQLSLDIAQDSIASEAMDFTSNPLVEAEEEERSLHFVKYMGSKRNLLPVITPVLRDIVPTGGMLLDLFAGTHAVGYSLKEHATIWGNDIQRYSLPIGETLLLTNPDSLRVSNTRELVPALATNYFRRSSRLFEQWLLRERNVLALTQIDVQAGLSAYDYM